VIVAPHPDDETLGCGGAIALLQALGYPLQVLVVSDGTRSHPRSRKYPPAALRSLREQETLAALAQLGVAASNIKFLRLADGKLPAFVHSDTVLSVCRAYLSSIQPATLFLPWRADPHPDHRATWQLIDTALTSCALTLRRIEYPVWDWDPAQRDSLQSSTCITSWRLDISAVLHRKKKAIAAYRSQTTNLIDDDPEGFRLTFEMLRNFLQPWELYFEEI
jgi:LmbE family N-acetylglucosaminyl deacetylase